MEPPDLQSRPPEPASAPVDDDMAITSVEPPSQGPARSSVPPPASQVAEQPQPLQIDQSASSESIAGWSTPSDLHAELECPQFTIDLSLPPEQRYAHIVPFYQRELTDLPALFEDTVRTWLAWPRVTLGLYRLFYRRLASAEQTAELRGIARAAHVPLWLLVAFNVILDSLLGTLSGGARVGPDPLSPGADGKAGAGAGPGERMVHFRALDWGMSELRRLVARLDFVRRPGGPVVASTITFFGCVGVVTGVRRGLSVAVNARPVFGFCSRGQEMKYRAHDTLILLGLRASVSGILRDILIPADEGAERQSAAQIADSLRTARCIPAYLTFCDGEEMVVLEKSLRDGVVYHSSEFQVTLNHDVETEAKPVEAQREILMTSANDTGMAIGGLTYLVALSLHRKRGIHRLWRRALKKTRKADGDGGKGRRNCVDVDTITMWMRDRSKVMTSGTHFGVIMDPKEGRIAWLERYLDYEPDPDDADVFEGDPGGYEDADASTDDEAQDGKEAGNGNG